MSWTDEEIADLNDNLLKGIVSVVAKEMIEKLNESCGNVAVNTLNHPSYNKTELPVEEYVAVYKFITKEIISSIRSNFIRE